MKKIFIFIVAFIGMILIAGCSETPTEALEKYVQGIKDGDLKTANEYSYLDAVWGGEKAKNEINDAFIKDYRESPQMQQSWNNVNFYKEIKINDNKVIILNATVNGDEEIPMVRRKDSKWKLDIYCFIEDYLKNIEIE